MENRNTRLVQCELCEGTIEIDIETDEPSDCSPFECNNFGCPFSDFDRDDGDPKELDFKFEIREDT